MNKDSISIIGTGTVGTALGFLLGKAGYPVTAAADLNREAARRCADLTGARLYDTLPEAAAQGTCIIIATPDDSIEPVCRSLSESGAIRPDHKVVHVSGACGLGSLASARRPGARVAAIHPIQTLADIDSAVARIPGSTFGVTADDEIMPWAFRLVNDLGGKPIVISDADRPLYHAAACIASNYLVSLVHLVQGIYQHFGLASAEALRAFWPLVEGTVQNIETKGPVRSLTGPIARGDIGTLSKHLEAILAYDPSSLPIYRSMGMLTADLALIKGTISRDQCDQIKELLKGYKP